MDLSTPRRLRLGNSRTFYTACVYQGAVYVSANRNRGPIENAIRGGRYIAPQAWKDGISEALGAGGIRWAKSGAPVDFGEELPVTGPALGGAPPARRSYAGPLPFGGAR